MGALVPLNRTTDMQDRIAPGTESAPTPGADLGCASASDHERRKAMSSRKLRVTGSSPERRPEISAEIAARTGIDDVLIERLVRAFYGRAAKDPLLGPIFDRHVADWEAHIAKLCDFWSSVALMTGRYQGTPMTTHMPLPLTPEAFDRWLNLFSQAAREVCPEVAANHFIERAHRIASSLEMGAATRRGELVAPRQPPGAVTARDP